MPNHIHGILVFTGIEIGQVRDSENRFSKISPYAKTLSVIVRTYKAAVTTSCRRAGKIEFAWQRNFYERIIRSEVELDQTRHYILDNPARWEEDEENPKHVQRRPL